LISFALPAPLGTAWQANAQDTETPYPNMVPVERYMMERNVEISLARSAAPNATSLDARRP
jgi:hypothetical protein